MRKWPSLRAFTCSALAVVLVGCGGSPVVRLLEDQHERARLGTVRGEVTLATTPTGAPLLVAILRVPEHGEDPLQIVDYELLPSAGAYSFFVPPARYRVIAFEDRDRDQEYDADEPLGAWDGFADVVIDEGDTRELPIAITAGVPGPMPEVLMPTAETRSLHVGDVVPLADARFGPEAGERGMWEPLAFLEELGAGLYLVAPHDASRTPVIFVHGMGGYPQEFEAIVGALDHGRFEPWLVSYPSGWVLDAVADYLARAIVELAETLCVPRVCVVAHSMGGLVVRRALRVLDERGRSALVRGFVSLASPFGGIASTATAVRMSPFRIPSWQSLVPDGPFLRAQYEVPLSASTEHTLLFAFDGRHAGDGVVPLTSQLRDEAQREAHVVRGFHTTHVGILRDEGARATVLEALDRCVAP
ncbi:MAG: alpha/beta fold hydrolase [Sandaracinaceae bacterium]|nr:alpha/beta fold hydrolase [Sandaracinaceae bacterium]